MATNESIVGVLEMVGSVGGGTSSSDDLGDSSVMGRGFGGGLEVGGVNYL